VIDAPYYLATAHSRMYGRLRGEALVALRYGPAEEGERWRALAGACAQALHDGHQAFLDARQAGCPPDGRWAE
jgi:hypothetical protein